MIIRDKWVNVGTERRWQNGYVGGYRGKSPIGRKKGRKDRRKRQIYHFFFSFYPASCCLKMLCFIPELSTL